MNNPASLIDHTLLSPTATTKQIANLCEEAVEYGFASVCIPPVFVPIATELLYGSDVKICSVVGFPCGYGGIRGKVLETADLVALGAQEVDMVVHIGQLLEQRFDLVEDEIAQVVLAAQQAPVKVIIECCYLNHELMQRATESVIKAGAAFVKTSTGFGPSGATLEDVKLLVRSAAGKIGVKAAGGIRSLDDCLKFVSAGASRLGTSSGIVIINQWKARNSG